MGFQFDSWKYNFPSTRRVVFGKNGMVCTSQPLAAQAGLEILKKGGNAIDAAIATAACMTVVEPTSNGLGSDAFGLIWVGDKLHGLNASGPAPMGVDADAIRAKGKTMPKYGWDPINVPGMLSGWAEMAKKFGTMPLTELFEPAIRYATEGYPVSPIISRLWNNAYNTFSKEFKDECLQNWFTTFAPEGKAPQPGDIVKLPDHAKTLKELAETGCESFYRGELAEKIDAFARKTGGAMRKEDLAAYRAEWVEPITCNYRGYTVHEIPPNGHGIVALMTLNILDGYEDMGAFGESETLHKQIEAMKLAFVDGQRYVTDPSRMKVTAEELLSTEYAAKRRELIGDKAIMPEAGDPSCGGTIYLCTADAEGNMVSWIQSNYMGFGSGVVVPGTGLALHNRGCNFNLDPESENCVAPGKKPYHTIIPGFLSKDGKAVGPFGVMGGFMQPQGHVQVIVNTVDYGMNPQEALDAPRWQWVGDKNVEIERTMNGGVTEELLRKGHAIKVPAESIAFGRGQIIWRNEEGVLVGATEPRTDGTVAAW